MTSTCIINPNLRVVLMTSQPPFIIETSDAVGTVPINWPEYNELRFYGRNRMNPIITFYCGQ